MGSWTVSGLALLAAGCANVHRPPASAASYEGPLLSRDISHGGAIFADFCNPCHAGRVNPRGYHWTLAQMRRQIREGNDAMPGITAQYLDAQGLEDVLAFLTVISAVDAELPPERPQGARPSVIASATPTAAEELAQPVPAP
jgi:mono/diheme cytochrome c family protein